MIGYRSEIDGLRAIAVVSVLLFHAGFSFLPGGFVGVDVFFVISGYLITSMIVKELDGGRFSFLNFYERRARRLLPPLIPVFIVAWLFSFFLFNAQQFGDFCRSVYAALGFVSNWFFLSEVAYFDGPGELTPLLHIWSLSVEEQFYFVFPVLLLAVCKVCRKRLLSISVFLAFVSLIYSIYLIEGFERETAFYSSLSRFWELLIGAILAISGLRAPRKVLIVDALEITGLLLILVPVVTYSKDTVFPGAAALLPTVGTALIISAQGHGRIVATILKSKPFVWVGLVSYSLYLWHWPILVAIRTAKPAATWSDLAAGLLFAFLLSVASYFLIEQPIRKKAVIGSTRQAYAMAATFLIGAVALVYGSSTPNFAGVQLAAFTETRAKLYSGDRATMISRIEEETAIYMSSLNVNFHGKIPQYDSKIHSGWTCSYDQGNTNDRLFLCLTSQAKAENVLVMGDSVGRDTLHALRRAFPDTNFIMLHQSSCPPGDVKTKCFSQSAELLRRLAGAINIKAVVINFQYRPREWVDVESGVLAAKSITKNVIMLGVSPVLGMTSADYIKSLPNDRAIPLFFPEDNKKIIRWSYQDLVNDARKMAEKHNIFFVNVLDFFCPSKQCRLWVDNRYGDPLLFDLQHLTNHGISEFSGYLKSQPLLKQIM